MESDLYNFDKLLHNDSLVCQNDSMKPYNCPNVDEGCCW